MHVEQTISWTAVVAIIVFTLTQIVSFFAKTLEVYREKKHLKTALRAELRGGFHYYPELNRPDLRYGGLCSHLLLREGESSVEREHLGADCTGDRVVRADTGRRPRPPSNRDGAGVGHLAALPARGHAVAQPAGDRCQRERRLHLAASLGGLGADGRVAACAFHASRHAAQPA